MQRNLVLLLISLAFTTPLALTSCTRVVARSELDDLNRSIEVETILLETDYSLYSPYSARKSAAYAAMITEEHDALAALFDMRAAHPILIQLIPVADLSFAIQRDAGTSHVQMRETRPVVGYASAREIVVYVARDPAEASDHLTAESNPANYRTVIRHELAHIFIHQLDLARSSWIQEGIAEVVETLDLVDGRLDPRTPLRLLPLAAKRWEPHSIDRVLTWQENGRRVEQGIEKPDVTARKLAMTLVRYLLHTMEDLRFVEALKRISAMTRPQLMAIQADWQQWLWKCTEE